MLTLLDILLGVLATWRMTALLCYEQSFEWVRQKAKIDFVDQEGVPITWLGRVLSCFWCTSLFMGFFAVLLMLVGLRDVLLPLALSGGSIILQHWTRINRYVEVQ